ARDVAHVSPAAARARPHRHAVPRAARPGPRSPGRSRKRAARSARAHDLPGRTAAVSRTRGARRPGRALARLARRPVADRHREQDVSVRRYRPEGVLALELWDALIEGQPLYLLPAAEQASAIAQLVVQLQEGS